MAGTKSTAIVSGLFFAFIFLTGFWVSSSGKPFPGLRVNVHKLIALAAAVFLVVVIRRAGQAASLSGAEIAAVVLAGILFLATGVTGGLASIDKPLPAAITTAHRILPYLTLLSSAGTLYLLLGGR